MDKNTCLNILELESNASPEEIKKAYKKLALKYHPDRQEQSLSEEEKKQAEEKFKQISEAYELLMNPEKFNEFHNGHPGFGEGFVDPSELFNHIFRDMHMNQGNPFASMQGNPFANMQGFQVNFNNPGLNNNVMRSSSVFFVNGQRIEKVSETVNGVTHEHTIIGENMPNVFQNIRFNFQ
jgi:DnaJ-class molecular chaperone